jgi:hypothetical protein
MGLRDILGGVLGLGEKAPEGIPGGVQAPAPVNPQAVPQHQMMAPVHMVPGTGQSVGYMQPGQGHALVGQMPQQQQHPYAHLLHALSEGANNAATGSAEAAKIMQQGGGQGNAGVSMAAQPHLYAALAQAYRGQ